VCERSSPITTVSSHLANLPTGSTSCSSAVQKFRPTFSVNVNGVSLTKYRHSNRTRDANPSRIEWLNAEDVEDCSVHADAFKSLVLDPEIKGVVEALSRTHIHQALHSRVNTDFIKGKGEGRIFLLHGPPGVGKTSTAGQ
jgi:flagellar biosynthesis GTPase FlhF